MVKVYFTHDPGSFLLDIDQAHGFNLRVTLNRQMVTGNPVIRGRLFLQKNITLVISHTCVYR